MSASGQRRHDTTVHCRGCKTENQITFNAMPGFTYIRVPFICRECGSTLEAQIMRGDGPEKCATRSKMIRHSKKLVDMLGITDDVE